MIRAATLSAVLLAVLPMAHATEEHEHGGHEEPEHAFTVAEFQQAGVTVVTAGPGEVDVAVELPGEVRPNADRIAHIAPRFPGLVRDVRAHVGDRVRTGDVLAVVESEQLAPFEIRAAFDGTVVDKHIVPGEAVTREEAAFIVADLSTVWVIVSVYQDALSLVRVGRPVRIVASHGGLEAEGLVSYVSPIVDQSTRTALARVVIANPDGIWRPGLFVTATVYDPVETAVVVPRRAVQMLEGKPVVFVVDGEHFGPRAVTIGRTGRSRLEVRHGLAAGERVADEQSFLVKAELAKGAAGHDH